VSGMDVNRSPKGGGKRSSPASEGGRNEATELEEKGRRKIFKEDENQSGKAVHCTEQRATPFSEKEEKVSPGHASGKRGIHTKTTVLQIKRRCLTREHGQLSKKA